MKHCVKGRKFGRTGSHRKAMLMNLVKSLLMHGKIFTTLPKAKDIRPIAEKLITVAKTGTLHARRQAISFARGNTPEVQKLFSEISEKFKDRNGGYLRIVKAGNRQGDNAPMAFIEFVD